MLNQFKNSNNLFALSTAYSNSESLFNKIHPLIIITHATTELRLEIARGTFLTSVVIAIATRSTAFTVTTDYKMN
jgi:hypothetical protein